MYSVHLILCRHCLFRSFSTPCLFSTFLAPIKMGPCFDSHSSALLGLHVSLSTRVSHLHPSTSPINSSILSLVFNDLTFFCNTTNVTFFSSSVSRNAFLFFLCCCCSGLCFLFDVLLLFFLPLCCRLLQIISLLLHCCCPFPSLLCAVELLSICFCRHCVVCIVERHHQCI